MQKEKKGKKLKVPYFHQHTSYNCGPASIEMLLAFFGKKEPELKLAKLAKTKKSGTENKGLINLARREGFYCYVHENSSINQIKHFINLNLPIIIDYIEPSRNEGHYAVITGYNKKEIILNDPWNGKNFKLPYKQFQKRWHGSNKNCKNWILVLSKNKFNLGRQYSPIK